VAHILGQTMEGKYRPVTPLTRRNSQRAARSVKARKAAIASEVAARRSSPASRQRARTTEAEIVFRTCSTCGGKLNRSRHVRCPTCWALQPGQATATRESRGRAIAASREELERWKAEHAGEVGDPTVFARSILPGLAKVKLSEIMAACGVAKSTASMIRSGRHVPALRHWEALAELSALT
jgi:hypothetical protein